MEEVDTGEVRGSLFDDNPDCVRFRIVLGCPFPEIGPAIVSTALNEGHCPASFRITSSFKKAGATDSKTLTMHGVVPMYPSLPSVLKSEVVLDITIEGKGDLSRFDKLFGSDMWQFTHMRWQSVVLGELNRILDLARHEQEPQYMIRNISVFDMEHVDILEVTGGVEILKSSLMLPQVAGTIALDKVYVQDRAQLPFFYRNYLDAKRHFSENRFHEMQISACNSIEAGSWYLWDLADQVLTMSPSSKADYTQRYSAVSKAIRNELGIKNGVPTSTINSVWKLRQKAMHGELVVMTSDEAASNISRLTKIIEYVDATSQIVRAHLAKV